MSIEHQAGEPAGMRAVPPMAGYAHPNDVLEDAGLTPSDKREILAGWVSDANAVPDRPWLRQLDSGFQVPVREIVEALKALDQAQWPGNGRRIGRRPFPDDDDDPPSSPAGARLPPGSGPGSLLGAAELAAA